LFIKTNDRTVSLNNVSNINILEGSNRIVFNLNYNIEILVGQDKTPKLISDYVYWDAASSVELENNISSLFDNDYFYDNFMRKSADNGYININEISSIKYITNKNRVIFNLSHPVTFKDFNGTPRITSEFVYVNCTNDQQFEDYSQYVENKLGET
jgi:hypothetical protein